MQINKPVFIIGAGRSGSTLLHEMMSRHPNAAWMSAFCRHFPSRPEMNRLFMHLVDWPVLGSFLTKTIHPREYYEFWDFWCRGFSTPCRDLFTDDVSPVNRKVCDALSEILTSKRNRLLIKLTGWPRTGFLKEIFPGARFIHILRDGRSVSCSMLRQSWWWGWRGPENWRWGQLTQSQYQLWESYNKSFIVLAAIEWMILMDRFDKAAADLEDDHYKLIRYEDLCANTPDIMKDVADFCELEWTRQFSEHVNRFSLRSANDKWKTELNSVQQRDLQEVLADYLQKYGYE